MDESSDNAIYADIKSRIAATYKLFNNDTKKINDNIGFAMKRKVAFATEADDDGATIVTSTVQEDGMSII